MLGGTNNFAADRHAANQHGRALGSLDATRAAVRANRAFLTRAVRYLASTTGIRQFLRDDDQPRFPRPAVDLPGVVNPRSLQAASTRHRRLRSQPPRARHAPVVRGATGEMHGGPPVSCTATSTPSSRDSSHGQTHL
jgi:hypothetical protein